MKNFNPSEWLQEQKTEAKAAADNTPLIKNYTMFGISTDSFENIYYDIIIHTKASDGGLHWWRVDIKPVYRPKRMENVSHIDLEVAIIDDDIHLPLGRQSSWQRISEHESAIVNTIPFFDNWVDVFDQISDIIDSMIAKKEGTDIEESTFFKKAKNLLENAGFRLVKESNVENIQDDFDFEDLKWMFNNYNSDYARSYGPNSAYEKVLEEFSETHDGRVPDSYAEWEEIMGWPIDDPAPDDTWYN